MISLRRNSKWSELIVYGDYELLLPEDEHVFAYTRSLGDQKLLVLCNMSDQEVSVTLPEDVAVAVKEVLITNTDTVPELNGKVNMTRWHALVVEI